MPITWGQIDQKLKALLGPPAPTTGVQKSTWITDAPGSATPILEKWDPPSEIEQTADAGFILAQNVICFQRGYIPFGVFEQYLDVYSDRFHHERKESIELLNGLAFDFLIVLKSSPSSIAAGCLVEFRCSIGQSQPPYLYISSLCTHGDHCGRHLAHQITHSVHTLGTLLLKQNRRCNSVWRGAIKTDELYMGLTVRKTTGCDTDTRLVKLYTECGLATRQMNPSIPVIDYSSFTAYSIYSWRLDSASWLISMWKRIKPGVLYRAEGRVLDPSEPGELMYYEFPPCDIERVKASGIVHRQHAYLHPMGTAHVSSEKNITFSNRAPTPGNGVFCIKTDNIEAGALTLKISIPAYFAASIRIQTHH